MRNHIRKVIHSQNAQLTQWLNFVILMLKFLTQQLPLMTRQVNRAKGNPGPRLQKMMPIKKRKFHQTKVPRKKKQNEPHKQRIRDQYAYVIPNVLDELKRGLRVPKKLLRTAYDVLFFC